MSRHIDKLPPPDPVVEKKVIVLSFPRTGTLGLYKALKILGYRPYHFVDCWEKGAPHVKLAAEALKAKLGYEGAGAPYGKEEFDKWFRENDSIVDVSAFFVSDLYAAYPDAKFILTRRDPEAWIKSVNRTFVEQDKAKRKFPLWHMSFIDPFTYHFFELTYIMRGFLWKNSAVIEGPEPDRQAKQAYIEHNAMVQEVIPRDRLLVLELENLGWDKICDFLECDIPARPYPRENDPNEFKRMVQGYMMKHWSNTLTMYATMLTPVLALGLWYYLGLTSPSTRR